MEKKIVYKQLIFCFGPCLSLISQLEKAVTFYSKFFPKEIELLKEYKGLLNIKKSSTSIPNTAGIVLGLLEFDSAKKLACKRLYQQLASKLHPDKKGGSQELFDFCTRAYKSGDRNTLEEVLKYLNSEQEKKDLQKLVSFATKRANILIEYFKSLPVFKLLEFDVYAGQAGTNQEAKEFMKLLLDNAINEARHRLLEKK